MNLCFSPHEQRDFLTKRGFTVEREKVMMHYSVYHNATESEENDVWTVKLNGQAYLPPCTSNYREDDWVEKVFSIELHRRLLML